MKTFVRCRSHYETLGWAARKSGYYLQYGLRLGCLVERPLINLRHPDHSRAAKLHYPLNFNAQIIQKTAYFENKSTSQIYLAMAVSYAYLVWENTEIRGLHICLFAVIQSCKPAYLLESFEEYQRLPRRENGWL